MKDKKDKRVVHVNLFFAFLLIGILAHTALQLAVVKIPPSTQLTHIARAERLPQLAQVLQRIEVLPSDIPDGPVATFPPKGLIADYPLFNFESRDGGVGDSSGNGNNADAKNGITRADTGLAGLALSFDGIDDYIVRQNVIGLTPNSFSFSVWVLIDELNVAASQIASLFADSVLLAFDDGYLKTSVATERGIAFLYTALPPSGWHHIALTHNGEEFVTYVDGVEKNRMTASFSMGASSLHLGRFINSNIGGGTIPLFKGFMSGIELYDRPLRNNEVENIYQIEKNQLIESSASAKGCYLHISINRSGSGVETQFSLNETRALFGPYGNEVRAYPPTTRGGTDYTLETVLSDDIVLNRYTIKDYGYAISETFDESGEIHGEVIELPEEELDVIVPYDGRIQKLVVANGGQRTVIAPSFVPPPCFVLEGVPIESDIKKEGFFTRLFRPIIKFFGF